LLRLFVLFIPLSWEVRGSPSPVRCSFALRPACVSPPLGYRLPPLARSPSLGWRCRRDPALRAAGPRVWGERERERDRERDRERERQRERQRDRGPTVCSVLSACRGIPSSSGTTRTAPRSTTHLAWTYGRSGKGRRGVKGKRRRGVKGKRRRGVKALQWGVPAGSRCRGDEGWSLELSLGLFL